MAKQVDLSTMTKKELVEYARKEMKKVNRSIAIIYKDMEKYDYDSDFLKTSLNSFRDATKTKSRKFVSSGSLNRLKKKELKDLINLERSYLNNARSTQKGRKAIFDKQYETMHKNQPNLTKTQLRKFQSLMSKRSESIATMVSAKYLGSEQVVEITKKYKVEDIIDFSNTMLEKLNVKDPERKGHMLIEKIPDAYFDEFIRRGIDNGVTEDNMMDYFNKFVETTKKRPKFSF